MVRKIRVLYTIPNFNTAGSGKVVYDLARSLDPTIFDVSIACNHDRGNLYKTVASTGCAMHIVDTTTKLRPYWNFIFRLIPKARFFKKQSFDVVHSWHWSSDWSEVLAVRLAGSKYVFTKKAMTWGNWHWKIKSYLSHFIITVNPDMSHYFSYKKCQQLIPFGLDTDYYDPSLFPEPLSTSYFKIITVAHLVPIKGIETILHALHELNDMRFQLDIIGDDQFEYAHELKAKVKDLDLERQVSFLGKQSDVRPFLANANLYIISSKQEGMPMALIEAMSMGCPVLASNVSGNNFVLSEFHDYLFDFSDVEMLCNKIRMISKLNENERKVIGDELRSYCISHFSLKAFVSAHETLYLGLKNQKH